MAMRFENLSEKGFGHHGPVISVAHFARSCPSWWNSNEPQADRSLPKDCGSKPKQAKHLGLQLPEEESSSTKSAGQSCHEMNFAGGANSLDQSMSSESGQDESCGRSTEVENKPSFLFEANQTHQTVWVSFPPAGDPYFSSLLPAYGPQALVGSQGAGIASPRVPLPLTFAQDGPIFVNAKQYNGILRRRESRAKLEAKNKLVKARKPYLHESRHRHALNRVRGSGGRFLSTKKLQELNASPGSYVNYAAHSTKDDPEPESHGRQQASGWHFAPVRSGSEMSIRRSEPA